VYHEQTYEQLHQQRRRRIALALVVALACAIAWGGVARSRVVAREQAAVAVREQVLRAALQCCAVEGSYPTSVAHLEEHYGLVINERDYYVAYEWLGDNIPPSVVVRPL